MKILENAVPKIKTYVGFSLKAGKCVMGVDNIIKLSRPVLVLYSTELSPNSERKLCEVALKYEHNLVRIEDFNTISPREGCKALAVKDKSLADAISKQLSI